MNRLEEALLAHEELLRKELAAAERKRNDLRNDLRKIHETIRATRNDLVDVEDELARRGITKAPAPKDYTITEEY